MDIQTKDGILLRGIPDGTPDEAIKARIQAIRAERGQQPQPAPAAPQQPAPESGYTAKDALAPWDAGLHMLTGMAAAPLAGIAGLAAAATPRVISPDLPPAADVVRTVQDKLTYQPRTKLGGQLAGAAGSVLSLPAKGADWVGREVTDATGSPALGTAANVGLQSVPALLGSRGVGAMRRNALNREADNSVTNATLRDATNNGYVVPPSQMAQTGAGRAVAGVAEGIAGPEALERAMSARNAQTVNAGVRTDAAIPGRGQIAEADIDAAMAPHFQVYEQARNVSPAARQVVDMWRDALFERQRQNTFYQRSANPAAQDAAAAAGQRANILSQMIEAEARSVGQPQLATQLGESRVALGRIGTVERSLNEATGNVNAQSLRQARDRGVPIQNSPNMNRAANVSEAFRGRLTQPPPVKAQNQSAAATIIGALGGIKGMAMLGLPWAMRQVLMSRPVQAAARPRVPDAPLTAANELNRGAAIAAMQQQEQD